MLVHGAWGGAHGFRHVRRALREAGHEVFTPSLTGIGERVHLASPQVGLTTHVTDVVNTVLYEDLTEVVLLGFSYGGMVVSGAVDHIGDRVAALVLLDAFLPADGDTVHGLLGRTVADTAAPGRPWLVDGPVRAYDDPAEAAFSVPRRTPQPVRCFTEPVQLPRPLEDFPFSRTYVRATEPDPEAIGNAAFDAAAVRARTSPAWRYIELATTHLVAQNRPADLARLLLELT
ncbi:Pimeloyl-ACP methyl ester carboxylesterase [Blastococcus tunisiensis]|uniref:Pimeloyl-ACP methyl ester carboxylesterase n=1 Tax=Blastococcus tunisiensis TaxID=1798228 RepID=A0A1I2BTU5_9ACTN|nr:Pimeloyl-ACP methyl ester carboxylesterase [Blastococcus sp. DSM 46838]